MASAGGHVYGLDAETGIESCRFESPLQAAAIVEELIASEAFVLLAVDEPELAIVLDPASCTATATRSSPTGQGLGTMALDASREVVALTWDDAGPGVEWTEILGVDLEVQCASDLPAETFRSLLLSGELLLGANRLRSIGTDGCAEGPEFWPGHPYGDLRDIGLRSEEEQLLVLGSSEEEHGELFVVDAPTRERLGVFDDFAPGGLLSLDKMASAGDWIFVPDGQPNDPGALHVLQIGPDGSLIEVVAFEPGEHNRLRDRFIDGGLLLSQQQWGTVLAPNTPLIAHDVGSGRFAGQAYRYGTANGNKHCACCLDSLEYASLHCDEGSAAGWQCTLENRYRAPVPEVHVRRPDGAVVALGSVAPGLHRRTLLR